MVKRATHSGKSKQPRSTARPRKASLALAGPAIQWRGIVRADPASLLSVKADATVPRRIAPGFTPRKSWKLRYFGGRTIPNLSFKSFYLGGNRWTPSDIEHIDAALSGAMADVPLNSVLQQYFPGRAPISTTFLGSSRQSSAVGATFTRSNVDPTIAQLFNSGELKGLDFDTSVVCLMLPPGAILTDTTGGAVATAKRTRKKGEREADSSTKGLGGYHGSCKVGATRIYFAVGVYSEIIKGKPNGIPVWPDPWKNVVATFYHELIEARTDPDVEEANRTGKNNLLGWYSPTGEGEIGDLPMSEADQSLHSVMVEVGLAKGGTAPIQLMWSNAVSGPEGPFAA